MTLPRRGVLIAVEGIDGAGKTTQVRALQVALEAAGLDVVVTKEPTNDTEYGRLIRASAATERLQAAEELHAFIEDRRAHVASTILPGLEAGAVVIVDRYYYSTVAYQGARGADPARVIRLNEAFAPRPDLLILLQIDAGVGLDRVRSRGEVSSFEREDELAQAAAIFDTLQGEHILRIDALQTIPAITRLILERLVDGPIHDRMCSDGREPACDVAWCVAAASGACAWPAVRASLLAGDGERVAAVLAAATAQHASVEEQLQAIIDAAQ